MDTFVKASWMDWAKDDDDEREGSGRARNEEARAPSEKSGARDD